MNLTVSLGQNCLFDIESSMTPQPAVKFSEHVSTTRKLIHGRRKSVNSDESLPGMGRVRQKVVRITLTDADATDSSSDDEREMVQRVKRHVTEINFEVLAKLRPKASGKKGLRTLGYDDNCRKRFRGVRRRRWGRWSAEAATVYDKAAVILKGYDAVTNFPTIRPEMGVDFPGCGVVSSPTSVIRYGDLAPFDCFGYCEVDAFGFDIDVPLTLPGIELHRRNFEEEELREFFDVDDFSLEISSMVNR